MNSYIKNFFYLRWLFSSQRTFIVSSSLASLLPLSVIVCNFITGPSVSWIAICLKRKICNLHNDLSKPSKNVHRLISNLKRNYFHFHLKLINTKLTLLNMQWAHNKTQKSLVFAKLTKVPFLILYWCFEYVCLSVCLSISIYPCMHAY